MTVVVARGSLTARLPLLCAIAAIVLAVACGRQLEPPISAPRTPSRIDVRAYQFDLTLPDTGRLLRGRATITIDGAGTGDTLRLDLLLVADSVRVDGIPTAFTARSGGISIPLHGVRGDSAHVTVVYHGVPDDGLIVTIDKRGHWQAFGDNWPDRARHWLPTVDHPRDKALVSWRVDAPARLTVVANGALEEKVDSGGRSVWAWRESRPLPTYLMVIAAAELRAHPVTDARCIVTEGGACLTQTVYTAADSDIAVPRAFGRAADITAYYTSIVAPFPYEKLAHLQSSTRFGGMENATAIFYSDDSFRSGTMSTALIAHETAHQWFGDAVTERRWADLWLSEGFATYFAELWAEHTFGRDTLVAHMRKIRREIIADSAGAVGTRPVVDTSQTEYMQLLNANSYQKGGFVLHMARALVGDSAFFQGVRRYYLAHRHGNADSGDLRAALEASSGRDLGWFFDQWLRRPGYPEISWTWSYDRAVRRVYVEVRQRPRFGNFRFPLVVEIEQEKGVVSRATMDVPAASTTRLELPFVLDAAPRRVTFDPDAQLLAVL